MKYRPEVFESRCLSCGSVEVLLPEDPRPASHCPDCGAERRPTVSSVRMKYEPFEGEPQTKGDQHQQGNPYRLHYRHPGTGLPAIVGVTEGDARQLLKDLKGMFGAPDPKGAKEAEVIAERQAKAIVAHANDEATEIVQVAAKTAEEAIERADKRILKLLADAKKEADALKAAAKEPAGKGAAPAPTPPPAREEEVAQREAAEFKLLELIAEAEQSSPEWVTDDAGVDAEGIYMKFPDGSNIGIKVTDLEHGLFSLGGTRRTGKKETPFQEDGLDTQKVLKLINRIAPAMQKKT